MGVRDAAAHPVILDGNINTTAKEDNAIHIMRIGAGTADTTLIDGITFTNGYAESAGAYIYDGKYFWRTRGSGLYINNSRVVVNNCRFVQNFAGQGGAVYFSGGSFLSTHSIYDGNYAQNGGAVMAGGGQDTMMLYNNIFVRDTATGGGGGAISASYGSGLSYTVVSNNVFVHNVGQMYGGGALYITTGRFNVTNNTFYANRSVQGGGSSITAAPRTDNIFANNSFWNNTGFNNLPDDYSVSDYANIVANNSTGIFPAYVDTTNLLGADGLWFTEDDGLRLQKISPHVNQGNNLYVNTAKDLAGTDRVKLGTVDIGAYEGDSVITHWYVNTAQDSILHDGTSWTTAFNRFEDISTVAKRGDTVWVAKGIYIPEISGTSFRMSNGAKIYGGFAGTEQEQSERNLSLGYNTVLQGNGSRVVENTDMDSLAVLDGFIIQNGNANAKGGGVLNIYSRTRFSNIVFTNNQAQYGAAIANIHSQTELQNTVIYNNEAVQNGGAIYDSAAVTDVLHTTFYNNSAANGGVLAQHNGSDLTMGNSISWNNTSNEWYSTGAVSTRAISYSFLQNNHNGTGNISGTDPHFIGADSPAGFDGLWFTRDDGLMATNGSLFLNKGNNSLAAVLTYDITDTARIQRDQADMGAYENDILNLCDELAENQQHVLYVNSNAPMSGDGWSWETALKTLHEALAIANCAAIDSIYIATGTYYPTDYKESEDRLRSFVIPRSNLHLVGGYTSIDTLERNAGRYPTILSGNINDDNLTEDNSYHVVTINNGDNVTLDGLVITGGNADSSLAPYNYGGGVYIDDQSTGISQIRNTAITQNSATKGGGIYNGGSDIRLTNILIDNNTATVGGGAIFSQSANIELVNATVADNTPNAFEVYGDIYPKNSIIYGNTGNSLNNARYSLIEGNTGTLNGNVNASGIVSGDIFTNPTARDYSLKSASPAINAGNDTLFSIGTEMFDLAGNSRKIGSAIDIGAYESEFATPSPDSAGIMYVDTIAKGNGSGDSWDNATNNLRRAIDLSGVQQVWVAAGTYNVNSSSFVMKNNVKIYGGFDPENGIIDLSHQRILPNRGMEKGSVLNGRNERPVVWNFNNGLTPAAVLDGFSIINGKGSIGGGMMNSYASPTLSNLLISNNEATTAGGGIYNVFSNVNLSNTVIKENTAQYGGGIYNNNSESVLTNVDINGNTATSANTGTGGGGIFNQNSALALTNVAITDNSTHFQGGGIRNLSGNPVLTNVTIAGNTSADDATQALDIVSGSPVLNNSIVYGTITGIYSENSSLIQSFDDIPNGKLNSEGITLADIFTNPDGGDYTLSEGSPAINAGDNTLYIGLDNNILDLSGNLRLIDEIIDLGAFEFQNNSILPVELVSFTAELQANTTLLKWLTASEKNNQGFEIERSPDGRSWEQIGYTGSSSVNGNSSQPLNYRFTDTKPLEGINYYRLKQVDFDGRFEYSPIRYVLFEDKKEIRMYPNPAKEQITISGLKGGETIMIYDLYGRIVRQQNATDHLTFVVLNNMSGGTYFIQIVSGDNTVTTQKIVVTQ